MKLPRQFYQPLAIGAPAPLRELPVRLERMIHFVPPHVEKVRAKVPELLRQVDVVLGNLEDAIPADAKEAARAGLHRHGARRSTSARPGCGPGSTRSTRRGRSTTSPRSSRRSATSSTSSCCRRSRERGTSTTSISCWRSSKPGTRVKKPILIHAILETAQGVKNVETIAAASPAHARHQPRPGRSCRFARHEDHAGRRRPSGLRGAGRRPGAASTRDSVPAGPVALHHSRKMVDACAAAGIKPFYGPFGDFCRSGRLRGAVPQRLPDGLRRRLVAAPIADRHRQAGVLARPGRSRVRARRSSTPCRTAPAP